jgi:leucyl aminopeptidase (aminopeptidase T)
MIEEICTLILKDSMGLSPEETVLVVTDNRLRDIGIAFYEAARPLCSEAVLMMMSERSSHGEEPPKLIAEAMKGADVVMMPTYKSLSHTKARLDACARGARIASMPQISEDMLSRIRGTDFLQLEQDGNRWAQILTNASEVHLITEKGTDLTFSIKGREGDPDNGRYTESGIFGNIPAGEAYVAPVEGTADGTLVVDGSMAGGVGVLEQPITIRIRGGLAREIEGGREAEALTSTLSRFGDDARNVAELGIGTNPNAILSGNTLEDEKVKGTVHIAFGDNSTFGGTVVSDSHLDGIILEPTLYLDGKKCIEKGKWL